MLDLAGAVQSADECRARKLPFTVEPQVQQSQTKSLAPELLQACTAAGLRRKGDHMVQKKLVATVVTSQRLLRASESDCRPSASEVTTTLQDHPQPRLRPVRVVTALQLRSRRRRLESLTKSGGLSGGRSGAERSEASIRGTTLCRCLRWQMQLPERISSCKGPRTKRGKEGRLVSRFRQSL